MCSMDSLVFTLRDTHIVLSMFIYCNRSLVKVGMLLMTVVLDGWPNFL
jgi:hypothetical protein